MKSLHNDKFIETRREIHFQQNGCNINDSFNESEKKEIDKELALYRSPSSEIRETFATFIGNKEEYYKYKPGNFLDGSYDNASFQDDESCFKCINLGSTIKNNYFKVKKLNI